MRLIFVSIALLSTLSCASRKHAGQTGAENPNTKVAIHSFKKMSDAEKFAQQRLAAIDELVRPRIDPYTGKTSGSDECTTTHLPSPKVLKADGQTTFMRSLYASLSQVVGYCDPKLEKRLKMQYLTILCRWPIMVKIVKHFYPSDQPWITAPVSDCSDAM